MFKQSQLFGNEVPRMPRSPSSYDKTSLLTGDNPRFKSRQGIPLDVQNCTDQRFMEIKKKYGIKDRVITQPSEVKPLREISLKSSNYNTFKNPDLDEKTRSTVFKSTMIYSSNLKQEPKPEPKREIRESIVRRVDESRDIPRFGGKTSLWNAGNSRSIDVSREQIIGSIDKIKMKMNHILNMDENSSDKLKQELQLRNQKLKHEPCKPEVVKSKVYIETNQDAFNKYYVPGRGSRKIQSIDDKMRRHSTNYTALENQRAKTPHLLQSRKAENSVRHRNFDQQIRKIEERIKKSNQEKKRLDIFFPERESIQLPKRILDYSKIQQRPTTGYMERRNRVYSNNVTSFKLKTEECEKADLSIVKQSGRLHTEHRTPEVASKNYPEIKNQRLQKYSINPPFNPTFSENQQKVELKQLVEALRKQVQLDENLRNAKVALSSLTLKNKWLIIKQTLESQGIFFSQSKVQDEFQITQEEHNPFFSVRQSNKSLDEVIQKYVQSYKHWQNHVYKKFNQYSLTKEGFCQQSIDLTKKGLISIEDMVRFLNFQTKNFYRNRDIVLIFRRITSKSGIKFNELAEALCK